MKFALRWSGFGFGVIHLLTALLPALIVVISCSGGHTERDRQLRTFIMKSSMEAEKLAIELSTVRDKNHAVATLSGRLQDFIKIADDYRKLQSQYPELHDIQFRKKLFVMFPSEMRDFRNAIFRMEAEGAIFYRKFQSDGQVRALMEQVGQILLNLV